MNPIRPKVGGRATNEIMKSSFPIIKTGSSTPISQQNPFPMPMDIENGFGNPLDGLAMLQSIRADLEKVGRMIVSKKDGQQFLKRAQILASINWLATNVPTCVLDHLGKEIRDILDPAGKYKSLRVLNQKIESDLLIVLDEDSETSELSCENIEECKEKYDQFALKNDSSPLRTAKPSFSSDVFLSPSVSFVNAQPPTSKTSIGSHSSANTHREENIPYISSFQATLLFVDISGFTRLSTVMDPENLSKVISKYLQFTFLEKG